MHRDGTDSDPTPTSPPSLNVLEEIGQGIVISLPRNPDIQRESPPEATIAALVTFCAATQVDPLLDIRSREREVFPTQPEIAVELDLVLRNLATGATVIVEVDGWHWHRRNPDEHEREIRRDRRIRHFHPHVSRFAAREIEYDPWGVLLEIYDEIAGYEGFQGVRLTPGLRAVAEACARSALQEGEAYGVRISSIQQLEASAALLPSPPPTNDPDIHRARSDHPRMHAPWHAAEVRMLQEAFYCWLDVADIARAFGRTEAAVWAQLRRMQLIDR